MRLFTLLFISVLVSAGYFTPTLVEKLDQMSDKGEIYVIFHLKDQADLSIFPAKAYELKKQYLQDFCAQTQQPIIDYLNSKTSLTDLKQWWISNCFAVTLPKWVILDVVDIPDIGDITDDYPRQLLPEYEPIILGQFNPGEDYIGWDIEIINAHQVWNLGYQGEGITVGTMDTGVDPNHPRLRNSYRGISAWYDAINSLSAPYDDNGHGTGTMGFLIGNYGIGVLPKAKWIAVKIMDENGSAAEAQIHDGFQWVADLPDSLRPKVMSNSWGHSSFAENFWDDVDNWKSLGVLPVFAIGNSGPNASTCEPPGRYPMALGVGATDPDDGILSYSSRGPTSSSVPYNNNSYWYRSDWSYHKPDISAPADPTTTTAPNAQYQSFGGTSAASPHAAGVAGLLLSKDPDLTPTNLYNIITDYAALVYPGSYDYPNDTFGWGRLDAFKVIQNTSASSIPNVFIVSASCTLDTDLDNELDPGETARIKIIIKNTGITVTNLAARLWEENADIEVDIADVTIGTLNPGQEVTIWGHEISARSSIPEESYVYFKLKFTGNGSYEKHDFFNIYVPRQGTAAGWDTIFYHTDPHYYWKYPDAYNDSLFNERFKATAPCTLKQARFLFNKKSGDAPIRIYLWQSTGTAPGAKLDSVDIPYTAINVDPTWTDILFPDDHYFDIGEEFHIGYMLMFDSNDDSCHLLSDDGNSGGVRSYEWYNSNWGSMLDDWGVDVDFHIQAVVKTLASNQPLISYGGSHKIDDSEFGNNDGWLDPGERVKFSVGLKNDGVVCHNVTGTLKPGDANTTNWITFIDDVADFGTVQGGDDGGSNALDPFIIQMFDESSLGGWDPNFKLVLDGEYGASNSQTYTDSFNFTVIGPWIPWDEDTLWYALGGDDLWVGYDASNTWYWATHSLFATDSIYVDTISVYVYDDNASQAISLPVKIWNVGGNGYPGTEIWSATAPATIRGWVDVAVGQKIPGEFYIGFQNVWTAAGGGRYNYIIIWGDYFIGDITFVDADNDWSSGPDAGYINAPLAFYLKINDQSPALSYFAPEGWTWPIIPSNSEQGDTVLDASLSAGDSTYLTDFVCLNRSDATAGPVTGGFDNYLFLDNWGLAYASIDQLEGWYYTSAYTDKIYIPGGRHTLLSWLDWNDEVPSNIFNNYLRIWGQQYVWEPILLPEAWVPVFADYAPDYTGLGAGPYYNVTTWKIDSWNNRWQGIGIRPLRFSAASDSIDLDLRLYSDAPTNPNTGLTEVIEASCLGPGKVDFIVWNGRELGTTYYPGVYSFGSANDSFSINFYPSRYFIDTLYSYTFSYHMSENTPIHIYDLILYGDTPYNEYSPNLEPAAELDLGIALFDSIGSDYILRRSDALIWSDDGGSGVIENFTYTNPGSSTDTLALVIWNNDGSGVYTLSGKGVTIGIEEKTQQEMIPKFFALGAPYPNPFVKQTVINYAVPKSTKVKIHLYDITGRLVESLVDEDMKPGYYRIDINTKNLAAGIYFCRMSTGEFKEVKKLILVK